MRILWFTPVPSAAVAEHFGVAKGLGCPWLQPLEEAFSQAGEYELGVVCEWPHRFHFESSGVEYFGIQSKAMASRARRLAANWGASAGFAAGLKQCIAVAREFRADVVHVHGTERYFGLLGWLVPVPVVLSLQGLLTVCDRAYRRGLVRNRLDWWDPIAYVKGHGIIQGHRGMHGAALREREELCRVDMVLGRTAWDRGFTSMVAPAVPYRECGELLRPEFYACEPWRYEHSRVATVYTTTGGAPFKGLEVLVEAVAVLRRLGRDVRLRVGGDVRTSQMGLASMRLARRLGLEPHITYCGALSAAQVASEIERCSVYACASHIDNSPNSLAEAMLIGAPCVASAVGGIPSMIEDGRSGLLVPDGDPWAFAAALASAMDDTAGAARMGREAREAALQRHNEERILSQLHAAYAAASEGWSVS